MAPRTFNGNIDGTGTQAAYQLWTGGMVGPQITVPTTQLTTADIIPNDEATYMLADIWDVGVD